MPLPTPPPSPLGAYPTKGAAGGQPSHQAQSPFVRALTRDYLRGHSVSRQAYSLPRALSLPQPHAGVQSSLSHSLRRAQEDDQASSVPAAMMPQGLAGHGRVQVGCQVGQDGCTSKSSSRSLPPCAAAFLSPACDRWTLIALLQQVCT